MLTLVLNEYNILTVSTVISINVVVIVLMPGSLVGRRMLTHQQ